MRGEKDVMTGASDPRLQGLNDYAAEVSSTMEAKGWHKAPDGSPRGLAEDLVLLMTEVAEAAQEYKHGHGPTESYEGPDGHPEGIPAELADVVLRVLDTCGSYGIDIEAAMERKMANNLERPDR